VLESPGALEIRLAGAAAALEDVDRALRGVPGTRLLIGDPELAAALDGRLLALMGVLDRAEADLDTGALPTPDDVEAVNVALVRTRDAVWSVRHDRLRTAAAIADLVGPSPTDSLVEGYHSIQVALSALDRLEVRGRDSAGLHVMVRRCGLDLTDAGESAEITRRTRDARFCSGAIRVAGDSVAFVYKAAAEIGELGDNVARLRAEIRADELLHRALSADDSQVVVVGHTRWASVGIISEANAHPLDQLEVGDGAAGTAGRYVAAVLNGDVDNHLDLRERERIRVDSEITTDTKVIPALVARGLAAGRDVETAFRETVAELEGSLAIAAQFGDDPDCVALSLRGSGQALYVGFAEDAYIVASEPYGLVEETSRYLRMDGETAADPARAAATRGQVVTLHAADAGTLAGVRRFSFDGTHLPVHADELVRAEITTRDIDRGVLPHFLLKEITEAPASFRKTLRGRIVEHDGRLRVALGGDALPEMVRAHLRGGSVRRVVVIGQGTAAVAGQSLAAVLTALVGSRLRVDAVPATEVSGFELTDDMSDTLVVAISQSGTTTDTNRTVDLVRGRGAAVVAIVNRRHSDLVDKSDGVLYTSDGRDVEMAVPSTKALYAQIAAGHLLALELAREVGALDDRYGDEILRALRELPAAMTRVLEGRDHIAQVAQRHAPSRRNWTVVGNGPNRVAASELRIKLSELSYRSMSCDITEDKKHIDLCAEPLILVCAAGLTGSNVDDVAKEIAIYRSHQAAPIVIATQGEERFTAALEVIEVPPVHPALGFVLSVMAGHLFGYEAALAIDSSARPLRAARDAIRRAVARAGPGDDVLALLAPELAVPITAFLERLRDHGYDGSLDASTAVRLASLLRYAAGMVPLDLYSLEHGKVGTPQVVVHDLTVALTDGIDELTRPVDAIKHQAKTVTVGISRSDEELLRVRLVQEVLAAGAARDTLSYRTLRTLIALDPAVAEVTGFTRYRVEGDVGADTATIHVVDRGGVATSIASVTERDPTLRGTKHRVATQRQVTVARGRDGRTLIEVPEVKANETVGITLLHASFVPRLPTEIAHGVLSGYQGRYGALKDAVTETRPSFDDALLAETDIFDLLTIPVQVMAERWTRSTAP
jgi:glucosamine--fructose-6-phosphate aminotransferase (isomerizing)